MSYVRTLSCYKERDLLLADLSKTSKIVKIDITKQRLDALSQQKAFEELFIKYKFALNVVEKIESKIHKKDRLGIRATIELSIFSSFLDLDLDLNESNFKILAMDQVQDPHNLGAIVRNAAFYNCSAIMITKDKSVDINETVLQTSSGSVLLVPMVQVKNLNRELTALKKKYFFCVGFSPNAKKNMVDSRFKNDNIVLVLGNEGKGVRPLVEKNCDEMCRIFDAPGFESLNVSVASGVVLHHFS